MKEVGTIFKVGDITTCKHCGHRIIRLERGWFHIKLSKSAADGKLVHTEDGSVTIRCSVNGCDCINAQPKMENEGNRGYFEGEGA